MNRDRLEQEAMKQLQRGNSERALQHYMDILRIDPKDRRIRQKVAELCLTLGRKPEAIRHYTDVARGLKSSGQERAAISVYLQLLGLRPDDTDAREELAECFEAVGRRQDARATWEEAFHLVDRRQAAKAIAYARAVARLSPGEVPMQVRVAELLEANGRQDEAFDAWQALGAEARRFGRADDQARFLERALALRPDDLATLLAAAEARIVQGEVRVALGHLQHAYGMDPNDVRLLTLLGRGLQGLGQVDKARRVWLQAARRQAELGDRDAQVDALRHALECGADDPGLRAELERADQEARRHRMRLDERAWAQPVDEVETRVLVRARTLRRYGFPERARQALEGAREELGASVAWMALYGELLISLGERDAGIEVLRSLRAPSTSAELEVVDRLQVLGHEPELQSLGAEDSVVDEDTYGAIATDQAAIKDEPTNPSDIGPLEPGSAEEALGDELLEAGDFDGAMEAFRRVLAADPSNTDVLMKIADVMARRRSAVVATPPPVHDTPIALDLPEPEEASVDFGAAFGDVDPDALDAEGDVIAEARALVAIGRYEDALDRLRHQDDVEALVVGALASRGLGRHEGVVTRLERAVQAASEHHPAYVEALWELAGAYLLRQRAGNAERLLDEISLLDPTWRPVDMAARRRGIEILRDR